MKRKEVFDLFGKQDSEGFFGLLIWSIESLSLVGLEEKRRKEDSYGREEKTRHRRLWACV
jgi:hypothetical protein